MKLTMDSTASLNLVRRYGDGAVWIGERALTRSCMLAAQALADDFRPQSPQDLAADDLGAVFALAPEIVVLGWGGGQPYLPARVRAWFLERRVAIEAMELGAACRTYNVLAQEGRPVVALLFPALR